jgi:hypothetical protein
MKKLIVFALTVFAVQTTLAQNKFILGVDLGLMAPAGHSKNYSKTGGLINVNGELFIGSLPKWLGFTFDLQYAGLGKYTKYYNYNNGNKDYDYYENKVSVFSGLFGANYHFDLNSDKWGLYAGLALGFNNVTFRDRWEDYNNGVFNYGYERTTSALGFGAMPRIGGSYSITDNIALNLELDILATGVATGKYKYTGYGYYNTSESLTFIPLKFGVRFKL